MGFHVFYILHLKKQKPLGFPFGRILFGVTSTLKEKKKWTETIGDLLKLK